MDTDTKLNIYIDGSCIPNPGQGGFALIADYPNGEQETLKDGSYEITTNQRMELAACIHAIDYTRNKEEKIKENNINEIEIITDSKYVYDNQWNAIKRWPKNDWRKKNNFPIENKDLWRNFKNKRKKIYFRNEINWQEGKSTPVFKKVDKLAKRAAKAVIKKEDFGYRQGIIGPSKIENSHSATTPPPSKDKAIIHIYAYWSEKNYYKLKFDWYSKNKKGYTNKYYAYYKRDETSKNIEIHRHHCYKIQFNQNSDQITKIEPLDKCPDE